MKRNSGEVTFPIWLLGDSNPERMEDILEDPFDRRHPAIHNIWTPVMDVIQDRVYGVKNRRLRVDTTRIYIRNAVEKSCNKPPANTKKWLKKDYPEVQQEMEEFGALVERHNPKILFCFGSFAFEFVRRSLGFYYPEAPKRNYGKMDWTKQPKRAYGYWTADKLGKIFKHQIKLNNLNIKPICVFPLLHLSIARGHFLSLHKYFTNGTNYENYFDFVGSCIGKILMDHHNELQEIWIK